MAAAMHSELCNGELRPSTLEEAKLFVGTIVERRFRTQKFDGWYRATIAEVNRGSDLNLEGRDAADFWCLLSYEPDGEEEAEDAEDQCWGFVFASPQRCRVVSLPPAAHAWVKGAEQAARLRSAGTPAAAPAQPGAKRRCILGAAASATPTLSQAQRAEQLSVEHRQTERRQAELPCVHPTPPRACALAAPAASERGGCAAPEPHAACSGAGTAMGESGAGPAAGEPGSAQEPGRMGTAAAAAGGAPICAGRQEVSEARPPQPARQPGKAAATQQPTPPATPADPAERGGGGQMHNGGGLWQPPTGAVAAATVPASWEGLQQHLDIVCAAALPLPSVACSAGLTAAFQALDLLRGLGGLGEAELLSFKLLLLADRERREPVWQELRRLLLRRSWAAAVAWVRGCVALLGGGAASAAGRATG